MLRRIDESQPKSLLESRRKCDPAHISTRNRANSDSDRGRHPGPRSKSFPLLARIPGQWAAIRIGAETETPCVLGFAGNSFGLCPSGLLQDIRLPYLPPGWIPGKPCAACRLPASHRPYFFSPFLVSLTMESSHTVISSSLASSSSSRTCSLSLAASACLSPASWAAPSTPSRALISLAGLYVGGTTTFIA